MDIDACAWLLATHRINLRSNRTIGCRDVNILPIQWWGGGMPPERWFVVMFCMRRIKKKENSRSETAANSIRTLKNMYKENNIFLGEMLILQIRNLRCQRPLELDGGGMGGIQKWPPQYNFAILKTFFFSYWLTIILYTFSNTRHVLKSYSYLCTYTNHGWVPTNYLHFGKFPLKTSSRIPYN